MSNSKRYIDHMKDFQEQFPKHPSDVACFYAIGQMLDQIADQLEDGRRSDSQAVAEDFGDVMGKLSEE